MAWALEMGTVARACPTCRGREKCNDPGCLRRRSYPLAVGLASHPCGHCGQISRHEWSPGNVRACGKACFLAQNPASHHVQAAKDRHGGL